MRWNRFLAVFIIGFGLLVAAQAEQTESNVTTNAQTVSEKTHWLTVLTQKRHNNLCRYFKKTDGRMCRPDEGTACKKCGG